AYGQSKLANLLFTFELDRRAGAAGTALIAAAAHPGYASTHLQAAGPEMAGHRLRAKVMEAGNRLFAQPDAQGALPQLYAATMLDVRGGQVFGPDGLFQQQGSPERVGTSRKSKRVDDARRLWEVSAELTGVSYPWPGATP
ncbi:MAG: short-chain dehydrogenase, partial [Acidimicrobiales bacterium]